MINTPCEVVTHQARVATTSQVAFVEMGVGNGRIAPLEQRLPRRAAP